MIQSAGQNPVILKELRGRMRGMRAFILISVYLAAISCMVSLVYLGFVSSSNAVGSGNILQSVGKGIFWTVTGLQLMMVCFIGPALTAGAISGERERQTLDLVRTTLIPARALVWGKLFSSLSFILLLLVAAFPLQSIAYIFGGVTIGEVLVGFLVLIVSAVFFCALGLFFSSLARRTLVSTVLAYGGSIIVVFGLPMIILTTIGFMNNLFFPSGSSLSTPAVWLQVALVVVGWLLIAMNPLATAVVTEAILLSSQSMFSTTLPLTNGNNILIISPWIGYVVFYLLASLLLFWLSVRAVGRAEK